MSNADAARVRRKVSRGLLWAVLAGCLAVPAWSQVPIYTISTLAGNGLAGDTGDGGAATSAELDNPRGIVSDPAGNVYFCDFTNNRVRKISTTGTITTVAGTGVAGYNGDNIQGTSARLSSPYRVAMDPAGNLYIADPGNNRIRKLAPNGIITTVAGNGNSNFNGDGGPATNASLSYAEDAVIDIYGNMFIADSGNSVVRKVDLNGVITTIAGTGKESYTGDGGPATQATMNNPVSLAVDPAGNIYISDQGNNVVRKVDTNGVMSTVAGNGLVGAGGDGGPAKNAEFYNPAGLALDAANNLYITDVGNNKIRMLLTNGTITTIAGNGVATGRRRRTSAERAAQRSAQRRRRHVWQRLHRGLFKQQDSPADALRHYRRPDLECVWKCTSSGAEYVGGYKGNQPRARGRFANLAGFRLRE